jgi:hypothetical protein
MDGGREDGRFDADAFSLGRLREALDNVLLVLSDIKEKSNMSEGEIRDAFGICKSRSSSSLLSLPLPTSCQKGRRSVLSLFSPLCRVGSTAADWEEGPSFFLPFSHTFSFV